MRWTLLTGLFAVLGATPAIAAEEDEILQKLHRLMERTEKLERHNTELEQENAKLAERIKTLENYATHSNEVPVPGKMSKDTEKPTASHGKIAKADAIPKQKQHSLIEALEGFSAQASFTTVAQHATGTGSSDTLLNYRGDIALTTPTIVIGSLKSHVFSHFRVGQGEGVSEQLTSFSGPNTTAFQLGTTSGEASSSLLLAEIWYQADIQLPFSTPGNPAQHLLTINFGKMDPFVFFDQNAVANDEATQFLSAPLVHNALLDNPLAANIGADAYGFSPGLYLSYLNTVTALSSYRLSAAVFGAGDSATFGDFFHSPFTIVQAETSQYFFDDQEGNYRFYLWNNEEAPTFVSNEASSHWGIGISIDQQIRDGITLFGRLGSAYGRNLPFDYTVSLGAELNGHRWQRTMDAIGLAVVGNRVSQDFHGRSRTLDADNDGVADYGFTARSWEQSAEIYYRFYVHKGLDLTLDLQHIHNPAGNTAANSANIIGMRANVTF